MPFGSKPVGKHKVNFDRIYDEILEPAVNGLELPEGGKLKARRTDKDFFTGDIGQEMFQYLQFSRFAVADISSLNANVWYELGVRHTARQNGTAILRQGNAPLPFDVSHVKVFSYDYRPPTNATKARKLIRKILRESLKHNRLDSPVQIALKAQRETPDVEPILREAENALRRFDRPAAIAALRGALDKTGPNALIRMRLGLLLRDQGDLEGALQEFNAAIKAQPTYAEAWREKGILEGRLSEKKGLPRQGEDAIRKAIALNPTDFDALASLGGVLRRQPGRLGEALVLYEQAVQVSAGHPYPLLMAIKLRAHANGKLEITPALRAQLKQAERMRQSQAEEKPPLDSPWCFFDLAEIRLYSGDSAGFLKWLHRGISESNHRYEVESFRSALQLLSDGGVSLDALTGGIADLKSAQPALPE